MRLKPIVVMVAMITLALPLAAQMGMRFGSQIPTLNGIWRPVVGTGAVYEINRDGNKTNMEFAVVGKEDAGGATGYWVETSMADPKMGGEIIAKILMTVTGNSIAYSKIVFQMPGQGPMKSTRI